MTSPATGTPATQIVQVRMGELFVGRSEAQFKTLLGSCVGLVLYDRKALVGGLAHIMLPSSSGHNGPAGKFVDTAVAELIRRMETLGVRSHRLLAKLAGGATMFPTAAALTIGDQNVEATHRELKKRSIPIVGLHCGGTQGRRMTFSVALTRATIEIVGADAVEI